MDTNALPLRLAAARTGAAVGPVLAPGLLRLTGKKRLDYVHRMSTQKVLGLPAGAAAHVAFLNPKGHVMGEGLLVVRAEDLLLELDARAVEPLRAHLVKYVLMDDVRIEDVSSAWRVVPVLGPAGAPLARGRAVPGYAWENPLRGAPAVEVMVSAADADAWREALIGAGATAVSADDLEVLRVLAGVPSSGSDIDASRLPMEAGLVRTAVSFDKGCYLGQEVVLRGTFRGQVQRGLVQLALPPTTAPGARLTAGGHEVGVVTSAVDGPGGRVGLGYLRRAHWNEGERLATDGGDAVVLRVLVQERDR